MSKLSMVLRAAKASPVKSVSIVAGVASVLVGGVYLTKRLRKDENVELVNTAAEVKEDVVAETVIDEAVDTAVNA